MTQSTLYPGKGLRIEPLLWWQSAHAFSTHRNSLSCIIPTDAHLKNVRINLQTFNIRYRRCVLSLQYCTKKSVHIYYYKATNNSLTTPCFASQISVHSPPCTHHCLLTTPPSPLCTHKRTLTTPLSRFRLHHPALTTPFSPPRPHHSALTTPPLPLRTHHFP